MTPTVIDRLADAISTQDIEALVACFAPTFSMEWPAHPARSFNGPDQVRRNWEGLFKAYPTIQATIATRVQSGNEIWGEWEFRSEVHDGARFWQRGVIIVNLEEGLIRRSRFYMEPAEEAE
ncbi:nuclear transport factor 2 family protein [Nocardia alni]|uniref:nuclear transport factor 2 family protein n=1 Tax=Nocardia alni TaxID=2815723 RepID=UPI001C22576E|nr:nuclear transport factor 2 family protein [Nocardia alni]